MGNRIIFHVDVNSAFLSWSAVYRLEELGETLDLRTVPSVVAGERDEGGSGKVAAPRQLVNVLRYANTPVWIERE